MFAPDEFVTAITVEIDHASRMLRYVSCGHPAFFVIRGTQILTLPETGGPGRHLPLGVSPEAELTTGQFALELGDQLVCYTDGLTEMSISHLKERLSVERLKCILSDILDTPQRLPVSLITSKLLDDVAEMSHEQVHPGADNTSDDDVTVLGLEVESREAEMEKVLHISDAEALSQCIVDAAQQIGTEVEVAGFEIEGEQLRVVLDEALTNAWKHGHGCDPDKPIILRWRLRNDLHIEVIDQG